jgi:ectoine hydroxylase-related dioxygenase (phytanoyl-CoA dioxygenase family)
VLPGSHDRGLLPHCGDEPSLLGVKVPGDTKWSASDLRSGDVVLFDGLTLHRALPHRSSPRLRLSVDYRYTSAAR